MKSKPTAVLIVALVLVGAALQFSFGQTTYDVLLVYFLVFSALSYLVARLGGVAQTICLVFATLVFGLAAIETGVLIWGKRPTTVLERGSFTTDSPLGWSPARPGVFHEKEVASDGSVIYDVSITIDENLTRRVVSAERGPTIAFFGDSFTYGVGLPDHETFPQSFANMTDGKFRVLNLAGPGYGPSQFLRALEIDIYDKLLREDPRFVVMLTSPWHAFRTSCKVDYVWHAPSYKLENGVPAFQGSCSSRAEGVRGFLEGVFRSTAAFRNFFASRAEPIEPADIDLYAAILIRAGELARRKYGVPTVILFLPDDLESDRYKLPAGHSNEDVVRKLRAGGLEVVDATLDGKRYGLQNLFIPGDGHPTGLAGRIWAEQLKNFIEGARHHASAPTGPVLEVHQ